MDTASWIRLEDFSCGIFFMFQVMGTLMLYLKGRTHRLQRAVFWLMFYLLAISSFEFYVFFIDNFLGSQMRPVTNMLQLTAVPLCLLIIYTLTHDRPMSWPWAAAHALPYALALTVYLTTGSRFAYRGIIIFSALHAVAIISYGFIAVHRYNEELRTNFSTDERLSLNWLRYLLLLYIVLAVTWGIATSHGTPWAAMVYNLLCVLIFGLLCYFVYRQESMLEAMATTSAEAGSGSAEFTALEGKTADKENNSKEEDPQPAYLFANRLETVFSKGKIYLNATLNLNDLARELGTNRTYLSNYLNQQLHTSFYEYVNQWRVRRAKELLRASNAPLEEIALQSGFNSMSSFRRYFAAHTGMSPLEYRKGNSTK